MTISSMTRLSAAALLLGGAMNATAGTSSYSEMRGFSRCVQSSAAESRGLVAARKYQLRRTEQGNAYFINASRWEEGKRADVRINCETTRNGRKLLSMNVEPGRFIDSETRVRIDVAGK